MCKSFPKFQLIGDDLSLAAHFKYLGHIITNSVTDNTDDNDDDVQRENIKYKFTPANKLIRKFHRCFVKV